MWHSVKFGPNVVEHLISTFSRNFSSRHCQTCAASDSINTFPDDVVAASERNGPKLNSDRTVDRDYFESRDTTTLSVPLIINTEFIDDVVDDDVSDINDSLDVDKVQESEDMSEGSVRSR